MRTAKSDAKPPIYYGKKNKLRLYLVFFFLC